MELIHNFWSLIIVCYSRSIYGRRGLKGDLPNGLPAHDYRSHLDRVLHSFCIDPRESGWA